MRKGKSHGHKDVQQSSPKGKNQEPRGNQSAPVVKSGGDGTSPGKTKPASAREYVGPIGRLGGGKREVGPPAHLGRRGEQKRRDRRRFRTKGNICGSMSGATTSTSISKQRGRDVSSRSRDPRTGGNVGTAPTFRRKEGKRAREKSPTRHLWRAIEHVLFIQER